MSKEVINLFDIESPRPHLTSCPRRHLGRVGRAGSTVDIGRTSRVRFALQASGFPKRNWPHRRELGLPQLTHVYKP